MIFYFSATGNSYWAAQLLSNHFNLPLISVTESVKKASYQFDISKASLIIFVFPVHSWGPALPLLSFVQQLQLVGYDHQPIYAVCTCGDDCGQTSEVFQKELQRKGLALRNTFSVTMPNSYILLPGFDVDSPEIERHKLEEAPFRIQEIIKAIESDETASCLYHAGSAAWLKTKVVYAAFRKYIQGKTKFQVTDTCISCGLCVKVCPENNIHLNDKKRPEWSNRCVQCLACIHRCPKRAIEYGKITQHKGRYKNPNVYPTNV